MGKIARGRRRCLRAPSQGRARRRKALLEVAAAVVFSATFSRLGHRQQQQHVARGRAWRGVTIGGHADKRQPSEGELLQRAPHNITITISLTLSPPGRTRPKKEDWLKKKDRKQRRPGCRRKKTRKRG